MKTLIFALVFLFVACLTDSDKSNAAGTISFGSYSHTETANGTTLKADLILYANGAFKTLGYLDGSLKFESKGMFQQSNDTLYFSDVFIKQEGQNFVSDVWLPSLVRNISPNSFEEKTEEGWILWSK